MTRHDRIDAGQVARGLASDAEHFCRTYFPNGRKVGNYWQMGDVTGAAGRSLSIRLKPAGGRKSGKWTDHATGAYGDLLDLLAHHFPFKTYAALLEEASSYLGHRPTLPDEGSRTPAQNLSPSSTAASGKRLFGYGQEIADTLAEHYLRQRSITRFGPALAFHPSAYLRNDSGQRRAYPALLAAITNDAGEITGCSRIFLAEPTGQIASIESPKRVLGDLYGNGIRFGPWQTAQDLIVGEGLENTLSVGTALPTAALISCLTATHLAGFTCPLQTERVWIAHDNDDAGTRAARHLTDRLAASGRQSFPLSPVRSDHNDDLMADGVIDFRQRLCAMIERRTTQHDLWPADQAA